MTWLLRSPRLLTMAALLGLALAVELLRILPADHYPFVPAGALLGLFTLAFVSHRGH